MTPKAIEAKHLDGHRLLITFNNNEKRILDMTSFISMPFWASIAPMPIFKTAQADGMSISWCNRVDLSQEDAYYFSETILF